MQVEIVTPESILFSGESEMVIAKSTTGEFGVLAKHEPMVVSLGYGPLRLYRDGEVADRFVVYGGFLEVRDDVVSVLSDDAEPLADIDVDAARAEVNECEAVKDPDATVKDRLARARARVAALED